MSMSRILNAAGFKPTGRVVGSVSPELLALLRDRGLLRMKTDPEYQEMREALNNGQSVDVVLGDTVLTTITPDEARAFGIIGDEKP